MNLSFNTPVSNVTVTGLTAILNGHSYAVYNQGSFAQLLVDPSMNLTLIA